MSVPRVGGELVFAFIAPVGTDYTSVADHLRAQLFAFRYKSTVIRLSSAIATYAHELHITVDLRFSSEFERIDRYMHEANRVYRRFNEICDGEEKNALFALHAIQKINEERSTVNPDLSLPRHAHIVLTLKRPEEVTYLRRIYGQGLHVISIFSPEEERVRYLRSKKHASELEAKTLVRNDENDNEVAGQRTGAAFHLADLFVSLGEGAANHWQQQIDRYLDILFSHPFLTPSRGEQAMYMAYGASLRSAQLGRQVGAAITNKEGDLLSVGCNEVPQPGGGLYWESSVEDRRDHVLGSDSNDDEKNRTYDEVLKLLPSNVAQDLEFKRSLRKSSLFGITEFGRAVHAEMEALSSCARRGVPTQGTILYTTTFPCHNCARHIVGFGVEQVVYIEPYPKSKATLLHEDAIASFATNTPNCTNSHVLFSPFVGISPRRYGDMFTITPLYGREVQRKSENGHVVEWKREHSELRLQMYPVSYIEREKLAVQALGNQLTQPTLPFDDSNVTEITNERET